MWPIATTRPWSGLAGAAATPVLHGVHSLPTWLDAVACARTGETAAMRMRRMALVGGAIAFARSERGQRIIADARRRYDTPENRAKVSEAVANLRRSRDNRGSSRSGGH